jgi:drug/metabolite transporter (DMT)-like permease
MRLAPIAILIGGAVIGADRPRGVQSIDMGISFLGAGFVVTRCDLTTVFDGQLNLGDLVKLLNVTIWAICSLLLRRRPADLPQDVTLAGSMLAGLVLLLPFVSCIWSGRVECTHRAGSCARDRRYGAFRVRAGLHVLVARRYPVGLRRT